MRGKATKRVGWRGIFFENGFHCAEAVTAAALQMFMVDDRSVIRCATGFGAGVGRTCGEMCGALAGAVIVVGSLHGRCSPETDWDDAAELSAEIRHRFIRRYDTTACGELRQRFGEKDQPAECSRIVAATAGDLYDLLRNQQWPQELDTTPAARCRCRADI